MRLTLLIPELIWSEPGDEEAHAPAQASPFAKILAQRHFQRGDNDGWELSLLRLAGLRADASLAVLRATGDGLEIAACTSENWLCADPVHLRFHQERLILADAGELALTREECEGLAARLNEGLDGRAEIIFRSPRRAYLKLREPVNVDDGSPRLAVARPLSRHVGRAVQPGDFGAEPALRALSNEIQMLLFADPLNQTREARGRPTVNALWLWGHGQAPARQTGTGDAGAIDALVGRHPLLGGIAAMLGVPRHRTLPGETRHALVLIDTLCAPAQYQDSTAYAKAWRKLDEHCLQGLATGLRRRSPRRVDLVAPVTQGELRWTLSPAAAWLSSLKRGRWPDLLSALASLDTPPPEPR